MSGKPWVAGSAARASVFLAGHVEALRVVPGALFPLIANCEGCNADMQGKAPRVINVKLSRLLVCDACHEALKPYLDRVRSHNLPNQK